MGAKVQLIMIKKAVVSTFSLLALAGCGFSEKFETVSVRLGNVSCNENIRIDSTGRAGITYRNDNGLGFNLNAPPPVPDNGFEFSKRCQDILKSAEIYAANMAAESSINLSVTESAAPVTIEYNNRELESLTGGEHLFKSSF